MLVNCHLTGRVHAVHWTRIGRLALLKGRGEGEGLPLDKSLYERQTLTLVLSPFRMEEASHFAPRSPAHDNQRTLALSISDSILVVRSQTPP